MIGRVTAPMGIHDDEAPRLSEIGRVLLSLDRKLDDFRAEVRAQLNDKVSREVYIAERDAWRDRVIALEVRARSITNTMYGGLATIITGAVLFYIGSR
jgi:hypothetical protein